MSALVWRTAGESHGGSLLGIVEGMPSGLRLSAERVDRELARRQGGYGRGGRMKIERDRVELLAGTRGGLTLGSPIAFRLPNRDDSIEKLGVPASARPGHADLAGCQKHGHRDPRAIMERASARETAARVAAGGIARQLLEHLGIEVFAHVVELGGVRADAGAFEAAGERRDALRAASAFTCLASECEEPMRAAIDAAREAGDTLGGIFEVRAVGLPPGLGGYAAAGERLTGRIGGALLSIPAIKGVEFGLGFEAARRPGSAVHDPIRLCGERNGEGRWGRFERTTNAAGGLEGGMTTGEPLVVRAAMKPISTLRRGLPTVDFETGATVESTWQRSDVSAVPAAGVVGEAMVALELAAVVREQFGGDSLAQLERAWEAYRAELDGI
ncbi:MAG: chorismate synthase [Planctomycetes bacterium]|nr:chorismate synthase [Planctomycetota bacterium]MDP6410358.1 chorismate synthase [Planctomycetota bacterium]